MKNLYVINHDQFIWSKNLQIVWCALIGPKAYHADHASTTVGCFWIQRQPSPPHPLTQTLTSPIHSPPLVPQPPPPNPTSQSLDPQPPSRRRPPSSPPTLIADNPSPPLLSHGRGRIRARPFQIAAATSSLPDRGRLLPRSVSIRLPLDSSRFHPPPASSLPLTRPPARTHGEQMQISLCGVRSSISY